MSEEFSDERFAQLFGFCLLRPTKEIVTRANEINALFDALSDEVGLESLAVFIRAGKTHEEHRQFLSNVAGCPDTVLVLAQKLLAPDSPERKSRLRPDV